RLNGGSFASITRHALVAQVLMAILTLSPAEAGRFSLHHGSYRHRSTTGLPGPQNISGRVLIAVEHQPAGGTDMGTPAQALLHARSAATAILAGIGGFHQDHSLASPFCLAREHSTELCPARVRDGLGQVTVPHQVGDPQVFEIEHIILAYQPERRLV